MPVSRVRLRPFLVSRNDCVVLATLPWVDSSLRPGFASSSIPRPELDVPDLRLCRITAPTERPDPSRRARDRLGYSTNSPVTSSSSLPTRPVRFRYEVQHRIVSCSPTPIGAKLGFTCLLGDLYLALRVYRLPTVAYAIVSSSLPSSEELSYRGRSAHRCVRSSRRLR